MRSLKNFLLSSVVAFALTGCISVDYRGDEFPETQFVKLFFDKRFVSSKIYKEMGTATLTAQEGASSSDIDQRLIEKGKSVGADAILITKKKVVNEGPLEEDNANDSPVTPEANVMGLQADGKPDQTNSLGDVNTPSRVATYEYETVINAVFYKKKSSIIKIQEEDKARAEGLEVDKKKVYVNKQEQKELAEKFKTKSKREESTEKEISESTKEADATAEKSRELTSIQTQEELNKTSQIDKKIINNKNKDKLIVDSLKSQETSTKAPSEVSDQKNFDKQFNPDNKNDPLYDEYKKKLNKKTSAPAATEPQTKSKASEVETELKTSPPMTGTQSPEELKKLNIKPPKDNEIEKILNEIKQETKKEQKSDGKKQVNDDDTIK